MKMHTGLFWGVLFIIIGALLILRCFMPFNIPVFKIFFGLLVIYAGVKIITGGRFFYSGTKNGATMFPEAKIDSADMESSNTVVFGKAVYSFSEADLDSVSNKAVKIDVAFGGADIYIEKNLSVIVHSNSAFGAVSFPNGNSVSFGSLSYVKNDSVPNKFALVLKVDVAFGNARIIEK